MIRNNIHALMASCIEQMRKDNYAEFCIETHRRRWQVGIVPFMGKMETEIFSNEIGEAFLSHILPGLAPSTQRAHRRSVHLLSDYLQTGKVRRRIVKLTEHTGAPALLQPLAVLLPMCCRT